MRSSGIPWRSLVAAVGLAGTLSGTAWAAPHTASVPGLVVERHGSHLTVRASDIAHRDVLNAVAARLGAELVMYGSLEEPVSMRLERQPWEQALKKVLFPANWTLIYESTGDRLRLAKVIVHSPAAAGHRPRVPASHGASPAGPPASGADDAPVMPPAPPETARLTTPLTELLANEDELTRVAAMGAITVAAGSGAVPALESMLRDPEPSVRLEAVEALARIGDEPATRALALALGDEHPYVVESAQEALDVLRAGPSARQRPDDSPSVPGTQTSLTELLNSDDELVRVAAVTGLPVIGGQQALGALQRALQDDAASVRLEAVHALAQLGGEEALRELRAALRDRHPHVATAAQEALRLRPH